MRFPQWTAPGGRGWPGVSVLLPVGAEKEAESGSVTTRRLATGVVPVRETQPSWPGVTSRPVQVGSGVIWSVCVCVSNCTVVSFNPLESDGSIIFSGRVCPWSEHASLSPRRASGSPGQHHRKHQRHRVRHRHPQRHHIPRPVRRQGDPGHRIERTPNARSVSGRLITHTGGILDLNHQTHRGETTL